MNAEIENLRIKIDELWQALNSVDKLLPGTYLNFKQIHLRRDGELFSQGSQIARDLQSQLTHARLRDKALEKLDDDDLEILGLRR